MYYTTTVTLELFFNIAVCDMCSKEEKKLMRCIDCSQIMCMTCRKMHDGLTILRAHRWEDCEVTADQPVSLPKISLKATEYFIIKFAVLLLLCFGNLNT